MLGADGELIGLWQAADRERCHRPPAVAAIAPLEPVGATGLPPFDADADCPKCGGGTVAVAYHPAPVGGFPCQAPGRPVAGEHLCRACQRCGYGWCEATADARPASHPALRLVKEAPDGRQRRQAGSGAAACT